MDFFVAFTLLVIQDLPDSSGEYTCPVQTVVPLSDISNSPPALVMSTTNFVDAIKSNLIIKTF